MEEQSYTSTHPLGHTEPVTGSLHLSLPLYHDARSTERQIRVRWLFVYSFSSRTLLLPFRRRRHTVGLSWASSVHHISHQVRYGPQSLQRAANKFFFPLRCLVCIPKRQHRLPVFSTLIMDVEILACIPKMADLCCCISKNQNLSHISKWFTRYFLFCGLAFSAEPNFVPFFIYFCRKQLTFLAHPQANVTFICSVFRFHKFLMAYTVVYRYSWLIGADLPVPNIRTTTIGIHFQCKRLSGIKKL